MPSGSDEELVEIAGELVPLAAEACTIDLIVDGHMRCVAAAHVQGSVEHELLVPARRSFPIHTGAPIVVDRKAVGELRAWSSRRLSLVEEALVCAAAGRIGAILAARAANARAEAAERSRKMLVAMVGHEVRAPLQTATIGLELLQMRVGNAADEVPSAWLLARFEQLGRAVGRLRDVADRLLDAAAIDASGLALVRSEEDLGVIVERIVTRLHDELEWAGCTVEVVERGAHHGSWDRIHIETAVQNLFTNAIKFGAGRPITVTVEDSGDDVRLSVRDRGCGIEKDDRGRVFESFFRGRTPGHVPGLGIGLSLVKRLVEAHGGHVACESEVGVGTSFVLTLPRSAAVRSEGPPGEPPEADPP